MHDGTTPRLRPADGIAWRPALDELVLLDRFSGRSWLLDPAGAAVWAALVEAGSVGDAIERLGTVDRDELARFAEELLAEGALQRGDGAG